MADILSSLVDGACAEVNPVLSFSEELTWTAFNEEKICDPITDEEKSLLPTSTSMPDTIIAEDNVMDPRRKAESVRKALQCSFFLIRVNANLPRCLGRL